MLDELKSKAMEANKAFYDFDQICCDLGITLGCSENLAKLKNLNVSEESRNFFENLVNISEVIDRSHAELEAKKDILVLEYALAKIDGEHGNIIYFVDCQGRRKAIVVESAFLQGEEIIIYGTRYLRSKRIGKITDSVNIDKEKWRLDKPL